MTKTNSDDKKPIVTQKPKSPFNVDPYNNRGGKSGGGVKFSGGSAKMKSSASVAKFKGGSGGDR
jgi:hypothetical protein